MRNVERRQLDLICSEDNVNWITLSGCITLFIFRMCVECATLILRMLFDLRVFMS